MRNIIFLLSVIILATSCGKEPSEKPEPQPPIVNLPTKSALTFPVQNEACSAGTIVSATESKIVFKWNSSTNTESYDLNIKNLISGGSITKSTTSTELEVTLSRNTPYSWHVISKSGKTTQTTASDVWKFYNSGPGTVAYAPFPAEIISPTMGQSVTPSNGTVNLDWAGSDVDGDIAGYDVYFGKSNTPELLKNNLAESILNGVSVVSNTTYYWKIVTKDSKGNTSHSVVSQLKVN
jgi:hypothetical protein